MNKRALILGISGQDGSYLAEYLLSLGYDVHGTIRRNSVPEHQETRISKLPVQTYYADLSDMSSIYDVLIKSSPDEIYNLAAQSHVRISFDIPQYTAQTNAIGVLNVLECITRFPDVRYYQASSSEMFGNSVDKDGYQRIETPMHPVSPYGASKLFGYNMTKIYRESYDLHACNGILFNHESPRRASNFVTNKIVKTAVAISKGETDVLELGNLDAHRDWGHSRDYVRAMHMILNHSVPADWVVSTMETHSVREFCEIVFNKLGLDYRNHVVINPKYFRPNELQYLRGDSTPIREVLGWEPETSFESLIDEMIESWI